MNSLFLAIALTICWYILSGRVDLFFNILGVISILSITLFTRHLKFYQTFVFKSSYNFMLYILWLIKEIFISSMKIAKIIWQKDINAYISPREFWLPTTPFNDAKLTLYANSITLTPGTICLKLEKNQIYIHALSENHISQLQAGEIEHKIMII